MVHEWSHADLIGGAGSIVGDNAGTGAKVIGSILGVGLIAFPLSIGVAVSRYRLYEIVTVLIVGTFIGVVALTTDVLPFSSRVGVAAAALFNPLRVRIQRAIDRRFNRARYDGDAIVAAFTARLRDAVEIDAVRAQLLDAVRHAVEPVSASVWIRGERG